MSDRWLRACYRIPFAIASISAMVLARYRVFAELWFALIIAAPILLFVGEIMGSTAVRRRKDARTAELPRM